MIFVFEMMDFIVCLLIIDLFFNIFFMIGVNFNFDVNLLFMYLVGLVNFYLYFGLIIYIYVLFLKDIIFKIILNKKYLFK